MARRKTASNLFRPNCNGLSRYDGGHNLTKPRPCKSFATERIDGAWYCAIHADKRRAEIKKETGKWPR